MTTGTRILLAARVRGREPAMERRAPSARTRWGPRRTLETRGRRAKMFESGIRIVVIPEAEREAAVRRPEKLWVKDGVSERRRREERRNARRSGLGDDDGELAFPSGGLEESLDRVGLADGENELAVREGEVSLFVSGAGLLNSPRVDMINRLLSNTPVRRLDLIHQLLNRLDEQGLQREALARELVLEQGLHMRGDESRSAHG
jgi:hypothetical protein